MKKQAWTGMIAATACTLAIGLSAQTTTQTSPTSRTPAGSASDRITVTGCLQRDAAGATAGATGTSGSTATTSKDGGYVLNITPSSSGSSSTTASTAGTTAGTTTAGATTTGTTAGGTTTAGTTAGTSGASSMNASSYRLDADDSKLSPHVGHKVEITGSLDKSMSGATAPSGSTSTAGAAGTASASSMSKLKVDSVRMIASSCSN